MTKSHIPAVNTPAQITVPEGQSGDEIVNESKTRLKHGRPIGSKDKVPRKRNEQLKLMESVILLKSLVLLKRPYLQNK